MRHLRGNFNKVLNNYRVSARKRGLEFCLSPEELYILTQQACFYCGQPPTNISRREAHPGMSPFRYSGVDRIDNKLGYTPDNVRPACFQCNRAKGIQTTEEWTEHIKRLVLYCISSKFKL